MAKGLRQASEMMRKVDLVIEARDARVPFSAINREFERIIGSKPRLIVYNKADLIHFSAVKKITTAFKERLNQDVIFMSTKKDKHIYYFLDTIKDMAKTQKIPQSNLTLMMVGMPNVGKSSLINSMRALGMRRSKALKTGANPGVTRSIQNRVKILQNPETYFIDTPGGIRDDAADPEIMADYLLYHTKLKLPYATDNILDFLTILGKRIGALRTGGYVDITAAASHFIHKYREGFFGRILLDDVSEEGVNRFVEEYNAPQSLSNRQARMAARNNSNSI
ncbi:Mitochondrial GTPase 1 [Spiromyces aspiralis]|uniref:Mitochondrial GTPase 1 n=1 Tax=Spiromyces aspiralis TaxID=68401 RepID=A0ACC1HSJ8_9FUNG|nr:Mitochondrial GTPase 1 [Spiromyces aspiralis]